VSAIKKLCVLLLIFSLATGLAGCGNKTGADAAAAADSSSNQTGAGAAAAADSAKTGEPVNLSYDMLLSSVWVDRESGEILTFTPDMFVDFENNEPADYQGLYYGYSDSEPGNMVNIYIDGMFLKDNWMEFDPETQILSLYLQDETLATYYIADPDYTAP
jgi:hypothetical protein